jgi:hypothetical protein
MVTVEMIICGGQATVSNESGVAGDSARIDESGPGELLPAVRIRIGVVVLVEKPAGGEQRNDFATGSSTVNAPFSRRPSLIVHE